MDLFIYTGAANKGCAAVTSLTDTTPVEDFPQIMLGDSLPLSIKFTNGTTAEAWSGAAGYVLTVALGSLDPNGQLDFTNTAAFSAITNGWSGRLSLNTQALIDAVTQQVGRAVQTSRFPMQQRFISALANGAWFFLQIAVTDPSGNMVTYASIRVFVLNRVLGNPADDVLESAATNYAWARANLVQNAKLSGIASNVESAVLLCGIPTANGAMPVGAKIRVAFPNDIQAEFELIATTTVSAGFYFPPFDYNASTNAYKWAVRYVTRYGLPASYNPDTALWHFIAAQGAANMVALAPDQTGVALPA